MINNFGISRSLGYLAQLLLQPTFTMFLIIISVMFRSVSLSLVMEPYIINTVRPFVLSSYRSTRSGGMLHPLGFILIPLPYGPSSPSLLLLYEMTRKKCVKSRNRSILSEDQLQDTLIKLKRVRKMDLKLYSNPNWASKPPVEREREGHTLVGNNSGAI